MSLATTGVQALDQAGSIVNFANGYYTGDGSGAFPVYVGFTPRFVKIYDITDQTSFEWAEGFPATDSWKQVAAGTITLDTGTTILTNGTVITVTEVSYGGNGAGDGVNGTQSVIEAYDNLAVAQLTFGTNANVSGKVYSWVAFG
jgi:hypothetical protein